MAAVLAFALYHFAENNADPDLWGHVLFGQRMLDTGWVEKAEPFSWTALGYRWINHEVLAEVSLGTAHRLAGGFGILLLKVFIGLAAFGIALRTGARGLTWPQRAVAWVIGALAVVEIAWGFAPRPQIFTELALAVLLWLLCLIHEGRIKLAAALPVLFFLWINTHGGALAGICILGFAAFATTAETWWRLRRNEEAKAQQVLNWRLCIALWIATVFSMAALLVNPWGAALPLWLIESVSYVRPEIQEWNPMPLGIDHAPTLLLMAFVVISLIACRRRRVWWESGVMLLVAFAAIRHVRHVPLFAVIALALLPRYAVEVVQRIAPHTGNLVSSFRRKGGQIFLATALTAAALILVIATVTLRKETWWTIEIPRDDYAVEAIDYLKERDISGNIIPFFDWGEMSLWEMPDSPVSFDGRLDTCYPREVIDAHWDFFYGREWNEDALPLDQADIVMILSDLAGVRTMEQRPGWRRVYVDPLATIFVRDPDRFPALRNQRAMVMGGEEAVAGKVPFPDQESPRVDE